MSLAERIAAEQVAYWRSEGVAIADCLEALGYWTIGRHRHHGRTWAEIERYVAAAWIDAVKWRAKLPASHHHPVPQGVDRIGTTHQKAA